MGNRLSFLRNRKLHRAASVSNDTTRVKKLLSKGYNVDVIDHNSATLLHLAAAKGNIMMVKCLLKNGAKVNAKTKNGCTPLHLAIENKHKEVSEFLIMNGADINAKDNLGQTPVHYLCKSCFSHTTLLLMSERGVNFDAVMNDGRSSLHLLANKMDLAFELEQWKICQYLLNKDCHVNLSDVKGWSPLHYAVYHGQFEVCRILLDNGADSDAPAGEEKDRPLHLAVKTGHYEIVMLLLDSGANVNTQNMNKWTPLHHAAKEGHGKIAELLLSTYNADPTWVDSKRRTPLYVAVSAGKYSVVSCILNSMQTNNYQLNINERTYSKTKTALDRAVKSGNQQIVKILLDNGAFYNLSVKWPIALSPVSRAAIQNNKSLVHLFRSVECMFRYAKTNNMEGIEVQVNKGTPINARDCKIGRTVLHFAVLCENFQMAEYLLRKGAKVHLTTNDGLSPLNLALSTSQYQLARMLIEHASVTLNHKEIRTFLDAKSSDLERTALHLATIVGQLDIVELLVKSGAVYNARDKKGFTPAEYAKGKLLDYFEAIDNLFKLANEGKVKQMAEVLEEYPTIVNAREVDDGSTALYWTLHNNHTDAAIFLLRYGANSRLIKDNGQTALHIASQRGNYEIIDDLMATDSRHDTQPFVDFKTFDDGMSALHLASNIKVARKLLLHGACYNIKNSQGRTPYDVVKNNDAKMLLERTQQLFKKFKFRRPNVKERFENDPEDLRAIQSATEDLSSDLMRMRIKFQDHIMELDRNIIFEQICDTNVETLKRRNTLQHVRSTKL